MQEIAEEAGVNKALLHYYFRSKERLAEAVFQRAGRLLFPPLIKIFTSDLALEEKVQRVVEHELTVLSNHPFLPGYLLCELNHHPDRTLQLVSTIAGTPLEAVAPYALEKLSRQIGERVRAGTMRPIAPAQFFVNLVALCVFPFAARPLMQVALGFDQNGFEDFIEERKRSLAEFFLNALRP